MNGLRIFSSVIALLVLGSEARAVSAQCWLGPPEEDERSNFSFDTKKKTFTWSEGDAFHPTRAHFITLGKKAVITVIMKPPTQNGKPIVEDGHTDLFSIFFDGNKNYEIQGDRAGSGNCDVD